MEKGTRMSTVLFALLLNPTSSFRRRNACPGFTWGTRSFGEVRQVWRGESATSAKYKRPAHQSRSRRELRQMEPDFQFLEQHDGQHDETNQFMSPMRAVQWQVASSFSPVVARARALQGRVSRATLEQRLEHESAHLCIHHTSPRLATIL